MEKKMTVPRSAVARIAPPSQPGTSTQTTVTSAGPPAAVTASRSAIGSRASAMTTSSAMSASASSLRSSSVGTTPMVRFAPASLAAARLSEPDLPAPPITATTGASYCSTIRLVIAGAPQTSITARLSPLGRSSGMTAAIERPKSTAYPSAGTCSERPSQPSRPSSMTSGVRVRETSVATRSPALRPSGDSGPTSSTVPTSMPPEPVSGFCILPRVATMSSTSRRTASPSSWCLRSSWRKDAASRLRRSTRMRTSSGHSSLRVSSRWAACGSTTRSSRTRCNPVGSLARTSFSFESTADRTISGLWLGQTGDRPPTVAQ